MGPQHDPPGTVPSTSPGQRRGATECTRAHDGTRIEAHLTTGGRRHTDHRGRLGGLLLAGLAGLIALAMTGVLAGVAAPSASASGSVAHVAPLPIVLTWQQTLPDAGSPVAQSSPSEATLDGGGPSVVVGDRAGNLWAFHLSNGTPVRGWPAHTTGAPIDSTAVGHSQRLRDRHRLRGRRQCLPTPGVGGYYAFNNTGSEIWHQNAPDVHGNHGVQAGMAVGNLDGVNAVVARIARADRSTPFNASNGSLLPGWPYLTADSDFSTASLADLYGNGQTEVVEGGDSSPGMANGTTYTAGGHLRVLSGAAAISSAATTPPRLSTPRRRWAIFWPEAK